MSTLDQWGTRSQAPRSLARPRSARTTSRWLPVTSLLEVERDRACRTCLDQTATLEEQFQGGLQRLWLACQPIVAWSERRVVAFEVLCRSEAAELPDPPALLAAAERLDQVWRLGRAVRRRAAERLAEIPEHCDLFVNLHPDDLYDPELYAQDGPLAARAERVVLEITERRGLQDLAEAARRVERLKELGYRIAIDDLGAGHSGLSSLAELAPDVVKIDRSLVGGVDRHQVKQRLIGSVVDVCESVGARVIAEGVESDEELEALLTLGCDWVQGYLLGRPSSHPRA